MSLWRQVSRGARALFDRSATDAEISDEVQHFLDQATAAHIARGLTESHARRAARLELGNVTTVNEQIRGYGWENAVDSAFADLRYATRRLRATPGFTAITVLTLALGIGATTAIWSAVNAVLFRPLPYPAADRIATVWDRATDGSRIDVTFGTLRELAERARSLEALAAMKPWQPTATGPAEPERLDGQQVSASYFRVFGVAPVLGRDFLASDDRVGTANVVILSDALWHRRYSGDRAIIGRAITLDDDPYVVIGVMPRGFESAVASSAEAWSPLRYDMSQGRAWGHHLRLLGRVRRGVAIEDAGRELDAIARTKVAEFPRQPWAELSGGFVVSSLQDDITRGVRPALLAILGAVSLVLVIVCVNVTNLLLARGAQRRGEFAVRTALGASRGRLVRQLLTESLLVAAAGGAAGMAVAVIGVGAIVRLSPPELPRVASIGVDGMAFLFGLALTTAIGLAFGAVPALQAVRSDPNVDLQRASRRTAGGHRRTRSALVVAEVALALLLLVSSGLMLRSIERLFAVTSGFDASNVLTMQIQTAGHRFDADGTTWQFFERALEAARQVPGVSTAAFTTQLPLSGDADQYGVHFDPTLANDPGEASRGTFRYAVTPGYFETMRIPLRRGRVLEQRDRADAPLVAVISEAMAKRRLPGLDPIGKRVKIGDGPLYTVVGVVGDVKQVSLALNESDAVYTTASQWRFADNAMSLVVRARGDVTSLAPAIREAIWSVDKDQPIVRVATMSALLAGSAASRRFALTLFEAFALAALVLAAAGIYGVLAGSVVERSREIGVRAALGASRSDIVSLVLRQGLRLTGLGVALGLVAALVATQALVTLLFGVSRLDPVTYVGVVGLLAVTAVIACALPAWRAARVDPVTTLRSD
jgi:putative ABC transport system permease protein